MSSLFCFVFWQKIATWGFVVVFVVVVVSSFKQAFCG